MKELKLFAEHYFRLGLNVTCINNSINEYNSFSKNILKAPNHRWKHLHSQRQSQEEFEQYRWKNATGVGIVTGYQDLRVIDIDGCNDNNFLNKVLGILNLPADYEWVTLTGSKNGFHIFINSKKFSYLAESQVVTTFPPKYLFKKTFEKIEILWNTHVVLPPSLHKSGGYYSFLNCKYPKYPPQYVDEKKIYDFINQFVESENEIIGLGYGELEQNIKHEKLPIQYKFKDLTSITAVSFDQAKDKNTGELLQIAFVNFSDGSYALVSASNFENNIAKFLTLDLMVSNDYTIKDINGASWIVEKNKTQPVICVIDIETDGLPKNKFGIVIYPNIVQVAWLLMDYNGNIFKKESELINYDNIKFTEAFQVTNIDINIVKKFGKKPEEVYQKLIKDVNFSDFIVAHNIDFDLPILQSRIQNLHLQDPFKNKKTICTMKDSVDYCAIQNNFGKNNYKFPKLTELYKKLFNIDINQKHNADSDALLTAKCFIELLNKKIIKLE